MPLKHDRRQHVPEWIAQLVLPAPGALECQPFPLDAVLERSLYYPACGTDGRPVQFLAGFVHSFIYVDYGIGEGGLDNAANIGFRGYRLAGKKRLTERDLAPRGWKPRIPDRFRDEIKRAHTDVWPRFAQSPFAHWLVFERCGEFDEAHGPKRFSLVYIGGDGVATYQALYLENNAAPLILTIIQPGHAFGGNYTNFTDPHGFLAETVLRTNRTAPAAPAAVPEYLVCGGTGMDYTQAFWPVDYPDHVEWFQHVNGNGVWRRR